MREILQCRKCGWWGDIEEGWCEDCQAMEADDAMLREVERVSVRESGEGGRETV